MYGKAGYDEQAKESTHKNAEHKPVKKFNHDGNWAKKKEQGKKEPCLTCAGEGHMTKNCPSKKDKK